MIAGGKDAGGSGAQTPDSCNFLPFGKIKLMR